MDNVYKVWAFKKFTADGYSRYEFIDFDMNVEPITLTESEYHEFMEGTKLLPYSGPYMFTFLIRPPESTSDKLTVTNVVQKCVENGKQAKVAATKRREEAEARAEAKRVANEKKKTDLEKKQYTELKKKYEAETLKHTNAAAHKKIMNSSSEQLMQGAVNAGIYTSSGKLTEHYVEEPKMKRGRK